MTFADALSSIVNSTLRDAMKRPSWGGYVSRSVVDSTTGAYTLAFVKRDGTTSVYSFDGSSWTAPATALALDADLFDSFCSDDWAVGTAADFETARTGNGVW